MPRPIALLPTLSRASRALALTVLAVLVGLGASACGGTVLPAPVAADAERASARWPDADLGQLTRGRTLYLQKCSGCHALVAPHARKPEAWPPAVNAMAAKINLPDRDRELITRYVVTMSELASPRAAEADTAAPGVEALGEPQVDPELR